MTVPEVSQIGVCRSFRFCGSFSTLTSEKPKRKCAPQKSKTPAGHLKRPVVVGRVVPGGLSEGFQDFVSARAAFLCFWGF